MNNLKEYLDIQAKYQKANTESLKGRFYLLYNLTDAISKVRKRFDGERLVEINVIDYNGLYEVQTSDLITQLLKFEKDGEFPILYSFVSSFLSKTLADSIETPFISNEKENIDICIREEGKYAILIENKLKKAPFQRNQLARYIMKTLEKGFSIDMIYVIILPGSIESDFLSNIPISVWRAPADWVFSNDERKCCDSNASYMHACLCDNGKILDDDWCNKKCVDCKSRFQNLESHIKVIDYDFPVWLLKVAEEIVPQKEIFIKSAMIQFAHYIKGLYNIRLNKKEVMENIQVLQNELNFDPKNPEENFNKVISAKNDLAKLQQSLDSLEFVCRLRIWQNQIENRFKDIHVYSDEESFYVIINNIYCGIWIENNTKYFWGFLKDNNRLTEEHDEKIIIDIIKDSGLFPSSYSNKYYIGWAYTENGANVMSKFIEIAQKLDCKIERRE